VDQDEDLLLGHGVGYVDQDEDLPLGHGIGCVDQDEDRLPKFEGHALRGGLEPKFEGHALRGDLELLSELHVVCRLALVHTGELQVLL
jgi:hypothetical protein